jgi:hypothetical protein
MPSGSRARNISGRGSWRVDMILWRWRRGLRTEIGICRRRLRSGRRASHEGGDISKKLGCGTMWWSKMRRPTRYHGDECCRRSAPSMRWIARKKAAVPYCYAKDGGTSEMTLYIHVQITLWVSFAPIRAYTEAITSTTHPLQSSARDLSSPQKSNFPTAHPQQPPSTPIPARTSSPNSSYHQPRLPTPPFSQTNSSAPPR